MFKWPPAAAKCKGVLESDGALQVPRSPAPQSQKPVEKCLYLTSWVAWQVMAQVGQITMPGENSQV